jgi:type IV pilus assembly protein PilE
MIVVVIVAVLAAIALPSYQLYIRKGNLAQAQQEMQKLAEQLERHKAKNFSYKGFDAAYLYKDKAGTLSSNFDVAAQEVQLPLDTANPRYKISIIGFYAVNEYSKDEEGKITGVKETEIKFDKLNKVINFDKATQADMFVIGRDWAMQAESLDGQNYKLLLNSRGVKCMNKKDYTKVTYLTCGTELDGAQSW